MKKTKLLTSLAALALVLSLGACDNSECEECLPCEESGTEVTTDADCDDEECLTGGESDDEENDNDDGNDGDGNDGDGNDDDGNDGDGNDGDDNDGGGNDGDGNDGNTGPTYNPDDFDDGNYNPDDVTDLCEEHTFGEYKISSADNRYHTRECEVCGYREIEAHQVDDDDGNCIHCSVTGLNTSGLTYTASVETYYVSKYDMTSRETELYIPATHEGLPVTAIGKSSASANSDSAFTGNNSGTDFNSLTFVSIPTSVTTINPYAFYNCYSLETIEIPDSVTTIGGYAFYYCYNLDNLRLPSGLTAISDRTFYDCYSLSSIELPDGLLTIGSYAFYYCYCLRHIDVPDSVVQISDHAFYGCYTLQNFAIPDGVTSFATYLFNYCYTLKTIYIPKSIVVVGEYATQYCYSLHDAFYAGSLAEWNDVSYDTKNNDWLTTALCYYDEDGSAAANDNENSYWHYVDGEPTRW